MPSSLMADELPLEAGDEEGAPTLFSGDPHDDDGRPKALSACATPW